MFIDPGTYFCFIKSARKRKNALEGRGMCPFNRRLPRLRAGGGPGVELGGKRAFSSEVDSSEAFNKFDDDSSLT